MSSSFVLSGRYGVAEADPETSAIYAAGLPEWPVLVIPLRLQLRCPKVAGAATDFREFRCRVAPNGAAHLGASHPTAVRHRARAGHDTYNTMIHPEIQLDPARVALLNRLRNGGDVRLRLDMTLLVDELVEIAPPKNQWEQPVWGLREHHEMIAQEEIVIPRSVWVERVLPQTGFGRTHIVELPTVPIESCQGMKRSFEALQAAERLERQGLYDDAVAKCRLALEPFFEMVDKAPGGDDKTKVPVLKRSWQKRLGRATYDWLNACLGGVKQAANEVHHLSSTTYGQHEAQMVLMITTALLAYAVKSMPEDGVS